MARATEIINKLLGAGLLTASSGFFIAAFASPGHIGAVIPGLLFGAGGFWLVARRESSAALEPQVQQRMERLAEAVSTVQNELGAVQERIERLSEEHDFMRQLAVPGRAPVLPPASAPHAAEAAGGTLLSAGPKPLAPESAGAPAPQAGPSKSS